jgi:soluble lytic murein transglycosylase-like protein
MKIDTLATNPRPQTPAEKKAWKAACDFEAIFMRQIFKNMDEANNALGSEESQPDQAKDIYHDMYDEQLADAASRSSALGLARWLYPTLLKQDAKGMASLEKAQTDAAASAAAMRAYGATDPVGQAIRAQGRAIPSTTAVPATPVLPGLQASIAAASKETGVSPSLLSGVIAVESRGRADAVSPKGAVGVMQLMPDTAREVGVTDRRDPHQSVMGGARYLAQMLKRFDGDETKALAAYNAGPGAVERFGGVPPYAETRAYVEKVRSARDRYEVSP